MNILVSSLLGLAAFTLIAAHKGLAQTVVSMWPPGPKFYLGDSVVLRCSVESNSTFAWTFQWHSDKPHNSSTMGPRHLVSGESYSITGLTREDEDNYWCKAEQKESNTTAAAAPVLLTVSAEPSPSLTLTPNSRQIFRGESITVQCPASQTNSRNWSLKRFPVNLTGMCSSPQGAVCGNKCEGCVFTADSENSGLYWCQSAEGRSIAVNIAVSDAMIVLRTPALPVHKGDNVILSCQYRTDKHREAIIFKNGAKITIINSSRSDKAFNMTINNVSQNNEGFYKCASMDGKMKSMESWLSVIDDPGILPTVTPKTSRNESWKWVIGSCSIVFLLLIPLIVWLVWRSRYHTFSTRSRWLPSKEDISAVPLPETKQDVTEVQWDMSWMELSNLLDKQSYPST